MVAQKLSVVAILCCLVGVLNAENTATTAAPHSTIRGVLKEDKYDANADFIDFDFSSSSSFGQRRLQVSNDTRCNTWCKLKESLGLTIVGLLLICIR